MPLSISGGGLVAELGRRATGAGQVRSISLLRPIRTGSHGRGISFGANARQLVPPFVDWDLYWALPREWHSGVSGVPRSIAPLAQPPVPTLTGIWMEDSLPVTNERAYTNNVWEPLGSVTTTSQPA